MDKATVIIPCFNVEDFIKECLDSVLLQGEIVHHTFIVDNNSTDSTVSKVREWLNEHPTFPMTITEEKKPGAPAARNNPLSQIETKWIQFLDADDLLIEGKIRDQIQKFNGADVICAASKHLAIDGTERNSIPEQNIALALMKGKAGNTCSNLFSTSSIVAINGWDESLKSSQEYDLMFRMWRTGAAFALDLNTRALIRERHSGQISQRNPREKWLQLISTQIEMRRSFEELHVLDKLSFIQCQQSIFDRIRILARYDRHEAIALYNRHLKPYKFHPLPSENNGKIYLVLFHLVGFALAERIKELTSKLN
jgi:glycosyltransferase involved in cell wall biosynthesis